MPEISEPPATRTPPSLPAAAKIPRGWDWRPRVRWFVAEIVVVVAGVLIALAINAWWSARQQARDEQRLLSALLGEFTANRERLDQIVAFHADVKATTLALLAHSANPSASLPADSVDPLLADVSWWSSYTVLESTVLDAAVQDGQLGLIRTDSVRSLIATWRSEAGSAAAQSAQEFAHYENVWLPLLRAEGELGQISNRATVIPGTRTPYQGEAVPLPGVAMDHRPLMESRALRNALVQKLWIENDVLHQYGQMRPLLSRVVAALEREVSS